MLGVEELKKKIKRTETTVECPVKGCSVKVPKEQNNNHRPKEEFKCDIHNIVISPSTFGYPDKFCNLLWKEQKDRELLDRIGAVKRENRMARDNSEDAVSWNVFRFLERNNIIEGFLRSITDTFPKSSEVIYWSYSQKEDAGWSLLDSARREFGERIERGSEPDIIIKTDEALFFIEAKLTAGNKTVPSDVNNSKKYETGGDNWFSKVFVSDYTTVAIDERKYELLRFWLLGTWIAKQLDVDFYLINLVRKEKETDIEAIFKRHIKENQRRKFLRVTWETIYQYISKRSSSKDKDIIMRYYRNKTIGYDGKRRLQKAFSIL